MREIVTGIVMWSWRSEPHGYDFNGYLVRHPDGNLCIDPVEPGDDVLALLRGEGVAHILVTNRNHAADAAYARGQGATIDAELHAGARLGPFSVVGVPGKSPGEVALYDAARRLLVVGDVVIGNPPGRLSLLREKVMDDPPRLRESVEALTSLEIDTVLVGDGEPILREAGARLRELVATFPA